MVYYIWKYTVIHPKLGDDPDDEPNTYGGLIKDINRKGGHNTKGIYF